MQGPGISKFSSTMVKMSTNWSFYVHLGAWNFKIFLSHGEDEYKISHSKCMQGPGISKFSSTMVGLEFQDGDAVSLVVAL